MAGRPLVIARGVFVAAMMLLACLATARAQDVDPEASVVWQKVRADLFAQASIGPGEGVLTLEIPARAQDASAVPVSIRAARGQDGAHGIERIWLVVDNNPSPIAAVFRFTPASGRADIDTRIRVEQYTHVRAIARTRDGGYYMALRYVKASGGCSAPPASGAASTRSTLGRIRLAVDPAAQAGDPSTVRLQVSHPNDSGLAMDQLTRYYTPAHFVRTLEVRQGGELVLSADLDFAISENPYFRFDVVPVAGAPLEARVVDNQSLEFSTALKLQARD